MDIIAKYNNMDTFLDKIGLPPTKNPNFYIAKFEDHAIKENSPGAYQHDYFEISFSMGYDVDVKIDGQKNNGLDFNLFFVSPNQTVHWQLNAKNKCTTSYILLFKPEYLPFVNGAFDLYRSFPFFNKNTTAAYRLTPKWKDFFVNYLNLLLEEYNHSDEHHEQLIQSYLSILLFKSKRELGIKHNLLYKKSRAHQITMHFEYLIQSSPLKRQPINYFAAQLNISTIYLSECIKKTTGKTAKAIIDEYQIIEAKTLLKHTTKSIGEISYQLGFNDRSYFDKYFKKHTGISPLQYQKT